MHKYLIEAANPTQLKNFVDNALSMLKETSPDTYNTLENYLYKEIYGKHFNEWLLKQAVSKMKNEDGSTGGHWTLEQTTAVAKSSGIEFSRFNEYDWNYVMNMIYSDYYGAVANDTSSYVRLAIKFLEDKDAKEGKAYCYYMAMKN